MSSFLNRLFFISLLASIPVVACGSETSGSPIADGGTTADGGPGSGNDGGPKADGATAEAAVEGGACVSSPKIGDPCTPGQVSCDRVDPCCAQETVCDDATKKWKESGIACLLCNGFACGSQSCQGGSVCLERGSGIDGGGTSYECVSMPAACARNWSCDCVSKNAPPGCTLAPANACKEEGVHVTLKCMGA